MKDGDATDAMKVRGVTAIFEKDSTPFPTAPSSPTLDGSGPLGINGEKASAFPPLEGGGGSSEPFDYQAMVSALTVQFLSEHEDTRVAALKWLIMLHSKVPQKVRIVASGSRPSVIYRCSDPCHG
jgi:vacuole morphology and inheritance protein 14